MDSDGKANVAITLLICASLLAALVTSIVVGNAARTRNIDACVSAGLSWVTSLGCVPLVRDGG